MSISKPARPPAGTYRVQLNADFGFEQAAAIAAYLAELGVSHLYASPYLQAAAGSTHGYDVVDPRQVSLELGGSDAHERFCRALQRNGLGQILDIVPNHMAIGGSDNAWWWDVLKNGRASRYSHYFDIDWEAPETKLRDKVLVPILGDIFGRIIEAGQLRLERMGGMFCIRYWDQTFPVAPPTLAELLHTAAQRANSSEMADLADRMAALSTRKTDTREAIEQRDAELAAIEETLEQACARDAAIERELSARMEEINASPDAMEDLLRRQHYRLAFWRTASHELNYRRFFNVNGLVGLAIEHEEVFQATHAVILEWMRKGILDGLRVDHPDGLRDPLIYLERLRRHAPEAYIVAEKILEPGEPLPPSWPVDGTTGYDFLYLVGNLFVDPGGERAITEVYGEFTGEALHYNAVLHNKKILVLNMIFGAEINRLTEIFVEICEARRRYRDYARDDLREVLREMTASFPVYRTYVQPREGIASEQDVRVVEEAAELAKAHRQDLPASLFDLLRDILLLRARGETENELVFRFQQLTGPVMAKGAEDTAFYNYNRLVSLNEVGGDPSRFGISLEDFHAQCAWRQAHWPNSMLSTSTHDTKRSEDVRIRISLLSEIPEEWARAARRWAAMNQKYREGRFPDRNAEYLLYQTLVGAWPIAEGRAAACMRKSSREAKRQTTWSDPNEEYEQAFADFVHRLYADEQFIAGLETFVAPLLEPAHVSSLAQTLIKMTAPGVPDVYQGCEVWNHRLVDPDNRRPVDFDALQSMMRQMKSLDAQAIWARRETGMPKMFVIQKALEMRRRCPEAFGPAGEYKPLPARGSKARHAVAFMRGGRAITIAPRLVLGLGGKWWDTVVRLPHGTWHNILTGETNEGGELLLKDILRRFPAALMVRGEGE